jgi:hypothetical protein
MSLKINSAMSTIAKGYGNINHWHDFQQINSHMTTFNKKNADFSSDGPEIKS